MYLSFTGCDRLEYKATKFQAALTSLYNSGLYAKKQVGSECRL